MNVGLKDITADDAELIVNWRNAPANKRWFPVQPDLTVDGHLQWYESSYLTDPSQHMFLITVDSHPIGTIGITVKNGSGELERMLLGDKSYARGGFVRQGVNLLMDSYGLNHYWCKVMPHNEPVIRFHRKNGFVISSYDGGYFEDMFGEYGQYVLMSRSGDGYWREVGK